MRKASAALCVLFVMALTLAAVALPAGAGISYPPVTTTTRVPPPSTSIPTTPTTQPTTPTTQPSTTTTKAATPTTQGVAPTQAAQAQTLAFTGSDSTPLVLIGIVAVVLGAILVVAARRRRSVGDAS